MSITGLLQKPLLKEPSDWHIAPHKRDSPGDCLPGFLSNPLSNALPRYANDGQLPRVDEVTNAVISAGRKRIPSWATATVVRDPGHKR